MEFKNSVVKKFLGLLIANKTKKNRIEIGPPMTKPDFKGDWNFS